MMQTSFNAATDSDLYTPNNLLDRVCEYLQLKNDAALSRALGVAPAVVSKIRHHHIAVGPTLLLKMHELTDLSIRDLRAFMGDHRQFYRQNFSKNQLSPEVIDVIRH